MIQILICSAFEACILSKKKFESFQTISASKGFTKKKFENL